MGGMVNKWKVAQHSDRTKQLASKDRSDIEGNGHLAWDPARKQNEPMKKTNGRSRTNPHNSGTKPELTREANREEANNIVNNHHINMAWCTIKYEACPGLKAWQSAPTILQIKWSSICNELHIDETPHQLFSSLSFMYPTILKVIKHGKVWSIWNLPI